MEEGGTANVSLRDWESSAWTDNSLAVEAQDFFLGAGETWDTDTRVWIVWKCPIWVVTQASCAPDSGGGGGGGGGGATNSGSHLGFDPDQTGDFFPGGFDFGGADYPFIPELEFDSLFGN